MQGFQGRLLANGQGVQGAVIEVVRASSSEWLKHRQYTGRGGSFHFRGFPALSVRVLDGAGQELAPARELLPDAWSDFVTIELAAPTLARAKLPRQPSREPLLPLAVVQVLHAAVSKVQRSDEGSGARASLELFLRRLPPLVTRAGLLDAAHDVLHGSADALRRFGNLMRELEEWSAQQGFVPRPSKMSAAATFDPEVWNAVAERLALRKTERKRVLPEACLGVVAAAALRIEVAAVPARRRLAVIDHQVAALSALSILYDLASGVVSGSSSGTDFLSSLRVYGGHVGGLHLGNAASRSFQGFAAGAPGSFDSGDWFGGGEPMEWGPRVGGFGPGGRPPPDGIVPIPPPGVGGEPYPGLPEAPDDEVPGIGDVPERSDMWDCVASSFPEVWRRLLDRRTRYEIVSVEPARACPGEVVTIRGENLTFEGNGGTVLFTHPDGSAIEAEPINWTDSEIHLVVPAGATCTDLELRVPVSVYQNAHCPEIQLFYGPEHAFHFDGGGTTVRTFRVSSDHDGCLRAGESVELTFSTCNAENSLFTLADAGGNPLLALKLGSAGSFALTAPALSRNAALTATLVAFGPCGSDRRSLTLTVDRAFDETLAIPFIEHDFRNWHGNITATLLAAAPRNLDELVRSILTAELTERRLGVQGSAWSYSNSVAPRRPSEPSHRLILTDNLNADGVAADLDDPLSADEIARLFVDTTVLPIAAAAEVRSVLDTAALRQFSGDDSPVDRDALARLVHVRASIKLSHLSWFLDDRGLAMATLGGSNGQTIAGIIGTATHGANPGLPPIQDFVRALHLVGPGGVQWWLEPASRRITRSEAMDSLKLSGVLDPCLRVEYDDALFEACLVSMGGAGALFSVVLEAAPAHALESVTRSVDWAQAGDLIKRQVLTDTPPFFVEIVMNASDSGRLTIRKPLPVSTPPVSGESAGNVSTILSGGLVGAVASAIMPATVTYLTRRAAELLQALTDPIGALIRLPQLIAQLEHDARIIEGLATGIGAAVRVLESIDSPDRELANATVDLLNYLWDLGLFVVPGRVVVQELQNQLTDTLRPIGTTVNKSFTIYNDQHDAAPMKHNEFERLVESYEYVVDAERCYDLAVAVRDLAREVQAERAFLVTINIRFTRGTRATLGMQRFAQSGHVEVWTIAGMQGNGVFHARLEELARSFSAIPHWGHLHNEHDDGRALDFDALYGRARSVWATQLNRIAMATRGPRNTFRHVFFMQRGLLRDL